MTLKKFSDQKVMDAYRLAQIYAVAPFIFQGIAAMRQLGILQVLSQQIEDQSLGLEEICQETQQSEYTIRLLLDMAVAADIVIQKEDRSYMLSKTGQLLADDQMTRVNFDFAADTCYCGMAHLTEALRTGKPAGLKELDQKNTTIYQALSTLPEPARSSWFNYDHYYSDLTFDKSAEEIIKRFSPQQIYDVGGNTGKFALALARQSPTAKITIIDLPQQCALAQQNIHQAELDDRITTFGYDLLSPERQLPHDADVWWMSQLVECFSLEDNLQILTRIRKAMRPDAILIISSIFGDRQSNDIAKLVVEAQSLYFTTLANGVSRFHHLDHFTAIIEEAGFEIREILEKKQLSTTMLFLNPGR